MSDRYYTVSFITCSRDESKRYEQASNLSEVLNGGPFHYQLFVETGHTSIAKGYNQGAKAEPDHELLVFYHDDVKLLSSWRLFEDACKWALKPMTGVIGVAGTTRMPKEGCWWKAYNEECRGVVHHPSPGPFGMHANCWPAQCAKFGPVAIVDGVFLMVSRKKFEQLGGFDESFTGFHFYDAVLSSKATLAGLQNLVVPLPIFHGSPGATDETYEVNRKKYVQLYGKHLPLSVKG